MGGDERAAGRGGSGPARIPRRWWRKAVQCICATGYALRSHRGLRAAASWRLRTCSAMFMPVVELIMMTGSIVAEMPAKRISAQSCAQPPGRSAFRIRCAQKAAFVGGVLMKWQRLMMGDWVLQKN